MSWVVAVARFEQLLQIGIGHWIMNTDVQARRWFGSQFATQRARRCHCSKI